MSPSSEPTVWDGDLSTLYTREALHTGSEPTVWDGDTIASRTLLTALVKGSEPTVWDGDFWESMG